MKKRKIEKIIAGVSVVALGITPPVSAMSETAFRIELNKSEEQFDIQSYKSRGDSFLEETERIIAEKKEQERLRLLEEERIRQEEEKRKQEEEAKRIAEENRKNSVTVNLDNVLEVSNMTAEELYATLMVMDKPEMAQLSWALKDAENLTNINMLFLAGLVANESAWNTSYKAQYQNNVTGYAAYNSRTAGSTFESKYDCIIQTAEWLKNEYLSEDGLYYMGGYTTYHINLRYCLNEEGTAPDMKWSKTINNISKTIESYYMKYVR